MAKSVPVRSAADAMIKACAQRFNLPKKALRKAVEETTLRLVAERIVEAQIDLAWKDVVHRRNRRKK